MNERKEVWVYMGEDNIQIKNTEYKDGSSIKQHESVPRFVIKTKSNKEEISDPECKKHITKPLPLIRNGKLTNINFRICFWDNKSRRPTVNTLTIRKDNEIRRLTTLLEYHRGLNEDYEKIIIDSNGDNKQDRIMMERAKTQKAIRKQFRQDVKYINTGKGGGMVNLPHED